MNSDNNLIKNWDTISDLGIYFLGLILVRELTLDNISKLDMSIDRNYNKYWLPLCDLNKDITLLHIKNNWGGLDEFYSVQ